jgi:hypothetical protein
VLVLRLLRPDRIRNRKSTGIELPRETFQVYRFVPILMMRGSTIPDTINNLYLLTLTRARVASVENYLYQILLYTFRENFVVS